MKRREFNKNLAAVSAVILSPFSRARSARAATVGGATPVFSYPSGFAGSASTIHLANDAAIVGSAISVIQAGTTHNAGTMWYSVAKQPSSAFTTQFTFQFASMPTGQLATLALTFCIQNTVSPPGASGFVGLDFAGDANYGGYGGAVGQTPPQDAIAVLFNASNVGEQAYPAGGKPNYTGLILNNGPTAPGGALLPCNDLNPYGVSFYTSNVFACTIVYDGSLLTMVLRDTGTGHQARYVWPLNLANTTNATGNWVGFTGGGVGLNGETALNVLTWSYWSGYNTRVATPTFSPTPGQYSGTQSVTISYPSGSTCYYTTNGLLPTSASTQYTGTAISVSANEVIQAVAIQSGYTDSLVATGAYQIGTSNVINLPNGFSANDGVISCGYAYKSGSSLILTDSANGNTAGAGWFSVPVNIQSFSTSFTLQFTNAGGNGMCFVIQNNPAAYASPSTASGYSAGPTVVGGSQSSCGYGGVIGTGPISESIGILNSVALCFDLFHVPNSIGLYTNGAVPEGSQTTMSGITLSSGHAINVVLTYDGTKLSCTVTDTVNSNHFTTSWTINIPKIVGGNTAYVGFTAGTGGATAVQQVRSWTHTAGTAQAPAVPAAPTNLRVQ